MSNEVVKILEELGNVLIKCREIPAPFIDGYWAGLNVVDLNPHVRSLVVRPMPDMDECESSTPRAYKVMSSGRVVIDPSEPAFGAVILERYVEETENQIAVYRYFREKNGAVGDIVAKDIAYNGINKYTDLHDMLPGINSEEIITIGRNKYFNPVLDEEEKSKGLAVVGEEGNRILINPVLPEEHAKEILKRFSQLNEVYLKRW